MQTTLVFDPVAAAWLALGLLLGLLLAWLTWGRAARRHKRVADSVANAAAAASAKTQAEHAQRELAASHAAMRPLADEIDRLKRELARAKRPVQEPLPGMTPITPMTPMTPLAGMSQRSDPAPHAPGEAMAGTGPIVVADAPTEPLGTAPDIRRLKGVGDKFAAALEGIGLGSIDRLARLNADEALDADTRLGVFNGRIARDRLVEQAALIDEGRLTEYAARFGTLG